MTKTFRKKIAHDTYFLHIINMAKSDGYQTIIIRLSESYQTVIIGLLAFTFATFAI